MADCEEKTAVAREQYAYAHHEYREVLVGIGEAIEVEETLKWKLAAAQLSIEIWRSREASNRNQDRTMR